MAVAVDIIRFQSYGLQDNVALLVLLHRKGQLTCSCVRQLPRDPILLSLEGLMWGTA